MSLNQLGLGLLFSATDQASGVMARVRNGFAQTRNEVGQFGSRSQEAFDSFGSSARVAAGGLAVLGALVGGTVPAAAAFGKAIDEISTLTDDASLNTGALGDMVKDLNARFGGGTAAQAKALYDGISAGASNAAEASALMNASNKLAVAGVTSVNVALDGLTSSLNAYGVSFEQAGEFSDSMFTAVRSGKTTIAELSGVIGRVAPTAAALKIPFDELNAAIATMTSKGLKTEEAATGMKAALQNVIQPTSDAAKEAQRLGVNFSAAAVREKGFAGVLREVTTSGKFTEDSLSKLFTSTEGLNAVLALTANGGKKFEGALEAMRSKSGAADKAFGKMSEGLAHQWQRLKGLLENAQIAIGDALAPAVQRLGDMLARGLEAFDRIPQPIKNMIVQAVAAAAAAAALAGSLGMVIHGARIVFSSLRFAGGGLGALGAAFGPVAAIAAVAGLAIAAFKVAVDKNLGGLGDRVGQIFATIKTAWSALVELFTTGKLSGGLAQEFIRGDNAGVNFAVKLYGYALAIKNFISGVVDGFSAAIEAARPTFEAFSKALDALMAAIGPVTVNAGQMGEQFDAAGDSGKGVGAKLGQVAVLIVEAITAAINVAVGLAEAWDSVKPSVQAAGESFGVVSSALGELTAAMTGSTSSAQGSAATWQLVGQIFATVISVSLQTTAATLSMIGDLISDTAAIFSGVVDVIGGILTGDWARVWRGAAKIVYGVVASVIDLVFSMAEGVAAAIDAIANAVKPGSSNLRAGLREFKNEIKGDLKDLMGVEATHGTKGAAVQTGASERSEASDVSAAITRAQAFANMPAAGAARGGGDSTAAATAAASAAAKSAVGALPPTQVTATLTVDGEVLGTIVSKHTAGGGNPLVRPPVQ